MTLQALLLISILLLPFQKLEKVAIVNSTKSNIDKMVLIPEGKFIPFNLKSQQKFVLIKPFYLDIYAVTNSEFLTFVKANPQWRKSKISKVYSDQNYLKHWKSDLSFGKDSLQLFNSPVTNISWFAANAYCKWKGKRLPTTNEWEYAASADIANRKKNNTISILQIILEWYDKPNPVLTPPIGSTFKNKFGLYDMHGLIWEWVYDFNNYVTGGDSRSNSQIERDLYCGAAAANSSTNKSDYAAFMRYGFRGSLKASYTVSNLGFRCASDK